jgi:hypothetical protein
MALNSGVSIERDYIDSYAYIVSAFTGIAITGLTRISSYKWLVIGGSKPVGIRAFMVVTISSFTRVSFRAFTPVTPQRIRDYTQEILQG